MEEPKNGVKKTRAENNTAGARNTALEKSSRFATSQNTTGSEPEPHQAAGVALIH